MELKNKNGGDTIQPRMKQVPNKTNGMLKCVNGGHGLVGALIGLHRNHFQDFQLIPLIDLCLLL